MKRKFIFKTEELEKLFQKKILSYSNIDLHYIPNASCGGGGYPYTPGCGGNW